MIRISRRTLTGGALAGATGAVADASRCGDGDTRTNQKISVVCFGE